MQTIKSKQIMDGVLSIVKKEEMYYLFLKWYGDDEPELMLNSTDYKEINKKYKQAK